MARPAQGWRIRVPAGHTVYSVRFTHAGEPHERSTGERDPTAAAAAAARIYAQVTLGVTAATSGTDLADLLAEWLAAYELSHTAGTAAGAEGYARGFVEFFGSVAKLTESGYAAYNRARIQQVSRSTLRKELSALRQFREWLAAERGVRLPAVPELPKHGHPGTRAKRARKRQATILSPADFERVVAELPERGPRNGAPVRAFILTCWFTSLRPFATVARLEAPLHYRPGAPALFITREVDKTGYERQVPLAARARAALDAVCPDRGLIFPGINKSAVRASLDAALAAAGLVGVSVYDIRHSRISQLANAGGPLTGVMRLAGHKHLSTTSKYVQGSDDAARAALEAVEGFGDDSRDARPEKSRKRRAKRGSESRT